MVFMGGIDKGAATRLPLTGWLNRMVETGNRARNLRTPPHRTRAEFQCANSPGDNCGFMGTDAVGVTAN
jgi:hypothetical protein